MMIGRQISRYFKSDGRSAARAANMRS
jgi:hypothetical protein